MFCLKGGHIYMFEGRSHIYVLFEGRSHICFV